MSYPYPQDRHLDRKEKGDEPYASSKETFAQARSRQETEAEAWGEANQRPAEDDEASLEENLRSAAQDVHRSLDQEQIGDD